MTGQLKSQKNSVVIEASNICLVGNSTCAQNSALTFYNQYLTLTLGITTTAGGSGTVVVEGFEISPLSLAN